MKQTMDMNGDNFQIKASALSEIKLVRRMIKTRLKVEQSSYGVKDQNAPFIEK